MSFIRRKEVWRSLKSGRKKYTYYEEVKGERVGGKVVQVFIKHLGKDPPEKNSKDTNLQT